MKKVVLVAAGMSRFGPREATYRDLVSEAGRAVFKDNKKISPGGIDGLLVSSVYPERSAFQGHVAPLVAELLGIQPSYLCRVESQCGSGTCAIRNAYAAIVSGLAEVVMVLGAEKVLIPNHEEVFLNAMAGGDREWETCFGLVPPVMFALTAKTHMAKYGTTEEQMAMVAVKNHTHSAKNPFAHFQKGTTLDKVMSSRMVAPPLKLFDCCPNTDGAAAVIVASEERARDFTDKPVYIIGSGQSATAFTLANIHRDMSEWIGIRQASKRAYDMAGITPGDIDFAETHDCFTISEIMQYEELGFCKKGEGGKFIEEGRSDYGGQIVINPTGGRIGMGHPAGATGVAQAVEMFRQLRDEAGSRQVKGAKIGLAHTMAGLGTENHIIIYGREAR